MSTIAANEVEIINQDDPRSMRASWLAASKNIDYYHANAAELWQRHSGKRLLIYEGGTVEAFDDVLELAARLEELDEATRLGAIQRWQTPQGPLIL